MSTNSLTDILYPLSVLIIHTCSADVLHKIAAHLCLIPELEEHQNTTYSLEFLLEILIAQHERRPSQLEALNSMPLYPTEGILWDESVVPHEYFEGEGQLVLTTY